MEHSAQLASDRAAPSPARDDPGRYVCPWKPFSLATAAGTLLLLGGGYWLVIGREWAWILAYILAETTIGLMLTLAATAWGCMIAMTEGARCGALFVMFPPYMFYYAATRWRWMSQPTVLFLCGIALAAGSILAGQHLLSLMDGG